MPRAQASVPTSRDPAYIGQTGAFIGHPGAASALAPAVPLLKRDAAGLWQPRDRPALERLLAKGYGAPLRLGSRAVALRDTAEALNRGDLPAARRSLRRLALPPLPGPASLRLMAEADARLGQEEAAREAIAKAAAGGGGSWRLQPRLPKGVTGGGEFTSGGGGVTPVAGKQRTNSNGRLRMVPYDPAIDGLLPGTASRQGNTVTITNQDGSTEARTDGSRAWRNNNPGNIGYGPLAVKLGAIGKDGSFAIFPNEATGKAAQESLLRGPNYRDLTVDKTIEKWAPPKQNNTARYQALVRDWTGLSGSERIGDLTGDQLKGLMQAQRRMEGWKAGTVTRGKSGSGD